jgi:carbonic anhydrase
MDTPPVTRTIKDLTAGFIVFLVAVPLCMGIAKASNMPAISGLLAGIVGGIVVGLLSGSQTSVSGPAAGLIAIVTSQLVFLGGKDGIGAFFMAVVLAGVFQIVFGVARLGLVQAFFPSSVIKGLLAAIAILLVLKQIPHLLGHDTDPEGELAFSQPDRENTFTELAAMLSDVHWGAAAVGIASIALLVLWNQSRRLKALPVPPQIVVVGLGVVLGAIFQTIGGRWAIQANHLVQVPVFESFSVLTSQLMFPDFSRILDPKVLSSAMTIAVVASFESLMTVEAVDKLDRQRRATPPNRELIAQGCGNIVSGMIGGLPIAALIVRPSVNISAGAKTKLSTIVHGCLIALCVGLMPGLLNRVPLAVLASVLIYTGVKLTSPAVFRKMWRQGLSQFVPFIVTVIAIVMTNLIVGLTIGLVVSMVFILGSNIRHPLKQVREKHLGGDVLKIELANQVSFLNRAALSNTLDAIPRHGQVLIDARNTDYIDPDVLELVRDYEKFDAPARQVQVSLVGFQDRYNVRDHIEYTDHSSRDVQKSLTPLNVLQMFRDGNERFRSGRRLTRDLGRQVEATAAGQFPLAVILTCIDSRTPTELIFDLGVGDAFTVRIAGNIAPDKVIGSIEYGCAVAGAKMLLVMGHTRCGAVGAAIDFFRSGESAREKTQCDHLESVIEEIQQVIDPSQFPSDPNWDAATKERVVDGVARSNVIASMQRIQQQSTVLRKLVSENRIAIVGGLYDVRTGQVEFFQSPAISKPDQLAMA